VIDLKDYVKTLRARKGQSRVYQKHQLTGLVLAELLRDEKHKALYIKLAKEFDEAELLAIAKNISERRNIKNKGAYFMRIIQSLPKRSSKTVVKKKDKKKQRTLFKWKRKK
jgi:hypothetical protein